MLTRFLLLICGTERLISGRAFSSKKCPVPTGIVDKPLPSSKYFPHPSSSPTHKCTLRCSIPCTVSNAGSQGHTSLRTKFSHRPPAKRNRNNSPLFELCAEIVIHPSESGEKEKVQNTTSSSPTRQTRSRGRFRGKRRIHANVGRMWCGGRTSVLLTAVRLASRVCRSHERQRLDSITGPVEHHDSTRDPTHIQ